MTFLQMGESATNVDEMISFAMEHLEHVDLKVCMEIVGRLAILLFPQDRHHQKWMWQTRDEVTRVTLWGRKHIRDNVILAMTKEKLGLGPKYYWIMGTQASFCSNRLFYVSSVLPWKKFCIEPPGVTTLKGPFLNESRREMAMEMMRNKIPPQEMPSTCCAHSWCFCPYFHPGSS